MRKKHYLIIITILMLVCPIKAKAQTNFFVHCYGGSTNFWSANFMQLPPAIINGLIEYALEEYGDRYGDERINYWGYRGEYFAIKDNGEKIKLDYGKMFGFKARDMFRNFEYGFQAGWQPRLSPFGFYVSCGYQFRQFRASLVEGKDVATKYKTSVLIPGIGIRITPFIDMLEDEGVSPIIEIGSSYNVFLAAKGAFNNDKAQFNHGLTSTFSIGARTETYSVTGGVDIDHFNLFNQEYTPDNGITYPYANIKSKHLVFHLSYVHDF